ncbi:cell division protein ZapA [Vagococcus acidifermentans]|uniref:Cell division protein ZapA n=1 Tax=Vagococcus acidifermentans TaxID=564710 RepID=A0A430ALR9_9ENTE|nr:cell division protein ZapA [Vagococcus acidifermentans]RSU09035.1 hypothetical protein CBF27_13550 [Vagococcus acidifermentans]
MTQKNKRYKTTIGGKPYTIIGSEDKQHMDIVSKLANEQLAEIMSQSATLTGEQAAVLLAINTLSEQVKQQEKILDYEKQLAEMDELREKAARAEELENRLDKIEKFEEKARKAMLENNIKIDEQESLNHIEAQKMLNQQVKEKIQQNQSEKKS